MYYPGNKNLSVQAAIPCLSVLFMVLALKYGFSRASSEDLRWILAPTALLVELISGVAFVYESPAGFINSHLGIIIAPVCSGINFMILSLCMVFFSFAHRFTRPGKTWLWLVFCMIISYLATIGVNGIRIAVSVPLICNNIHYGWMTPDRIHRAAGIVIYFTGLFLLYVLMNRISAGIPQKLHGNSWYSKKAVFLVPLFWYVLITILVPLFNGSYRANGERFLEHGFTIIVLCGAILAAIHAIRFLLRRSGACPITEDQRSQSQGSKRKP